MTKIQVISGSFAARRSSKIIPPNLLVVENVWWVLAGHLKLYTIKIHFTISLFPIPSWALQKPALLTYCKKSRPGPARPAVRPGPLTALILNIQCTGESW